jgi:multidrug efflux pump subunit AcrA (membrane-fusion protein)
MKNRKFIACMLSAGIMVSVLGGCGTKTANDSKPSINIESYTKIGYDTTTVQSGDISPVLELSLTPDEFETKSYKIEQSDYEVEKVNVAEGDRVEVDDVMVEFKADDIQKTIDEYTEEKEENEMLIEHYQKLQQISGEDYSSDIEGLREDIDIANTYIEEQNEKKKDYSLIAEKAGTVTYVNEWLNYGYVNANEVLVTVASGSSNYTATTDDSYEFKVGDVYQADFQLASYDMKVVSVNEYKDAATDKNMKTILFEPMENMTGVTETDKLTMTIKKPVISNVVYVDENVVLESEKGKYYVYTINEDGYRTAVEVTIGDTVDGYTIIETGLTAGEQVTLN